MTESEIRAERPIMTILGLIGQRWTLRILWELRDGPLTFRALRDRCDQVSPTILNQRLKQLREHDLVSLEPDGYTPTEWCLELGELLNALNDWSKKWGERERETPPSD